MYRIPDTVAGEQVTFHYVQYKVDISEFREWLLRHKWVAIDTESTGLNTFHPDWRLRTVQYGDAHDCYIIPAKYARLIAWSTRQDIRWIAHNGPHDIRSIDGHLGFETGVVCQGETYIPSHHMDSRNQQEGGIGHGLTELACALVDPTAYRWERELKRVFKQIEIPVPGEVYKSGPRKGLQKVRKARLSEGYALIDPEHPVYLAYAGSDPVLTYRVWQKLKHVVREQRQLYKFDHAVQVACDRLQRRGLRLDVDYTERLSAAFTRRSNRMIRIAAEFGCANIQSGQQIAETLATLGVRLTERTKGGTQYKTDDGILRGILADNPTGEVKQFITAVLVAKQMIKRRESYTESMLDEMDADGRIHASTNSLGARTARMSVSSPPLQQLPTKDRDDE